MPAPCFRRRHRRVVNCRSHDTRSHLPKPRAARSRRDHRRPASGARRRRFGQDARAHVPHRAPRRRPAREPCRDTRHHLHQQGGRRDARAAGRPVRAERALDVGAHLPRDVRAHAARGWRPARLHAQLHHLRPGRLQAPAQGGHARARDRRQALSGQRRRQPHLHGQERADELERVRVQGHHADGQEGRPDHAALPGAAAGGQRDGLRRPARQRAPAAQRAPAVVPRLPAALPLHQRRRVPGHQPRAVHAHQPAREQSRQPDGRGRRRPVDLLVARRRHHQHPRVRARLPGGQGGQARAELPLDGADPRGSQRGGGQQRQPQAQDAVHRQRRGREDLELPGQRRARRGALHRRRDRAARARRAPRLHRLRGLLPHQRAVPLAGRRAAARRRAVPDCRRHALLRPRRDPRRDGATSRLW